MVYRVTFGNVTRELTFEQLQKAPDSQLSRHFLSDQQVGEKGELTLCAGDALNAWRSGTEDLFKVRILQVLPARPEN